MFLNIENHGQGNVAAVDESGAILHYGQLCDCVGQMSQLLQSRSLVFSFCENTIGSPVGYISFMSNGMVQLLLDRDMPAVLVTGLVETYNPSFIWAPVDKCLWTPADRGLPELRAIFSGWGYHLYETGLHPFPLHCDLALLVTTSGSTGSPKLVRQSYGNIVSNTRSIAAYLKIGDSERPITTLPMQYVYGTSIVNTHLMQGATLLLTTKGFMQKEFWQFFTEQGATSIAGVPYTYEMLKKLRFTEMNLPTLRTMTQAGGKLLPDLHKEFAQYAIDNGKEFVVMYGAAEATARMGYLPPGKSLEKYGAMGIAIPGGRFDLVDDVGNIVPKVGTVGQLVYYGDNVTLGYAECGADLAKGDERYGRLETGDMATRDEDGYYTIVGRKKRFLKIYGNRVGLDETERLIKTHLGGVECACCGVDDKMYIFITDGLMKKGLLDFISRYTGLNTKAFVIKTLDEIPKNDAGKTLYSKLEEYYE